MPLIPLHVPSERPGGEVRREIMKARAAKVTRSVSEVWITFGSAKFFSCSRWSRKQTSAGKSTHVCSSQLWRNTLDLSDQVFYLCHLGYLADLLQKGYLGYLGLLIMMLLLGSLVGQMRLHHYL